MSPTVPKAKARSDRVKRSFYEGRLGALEEQEIVTGESLKVREAEVKRQLDEIQAQADAQKAEVQAALKVEQRRLGHVTAAKEEAAAELAKLPAAPDEGDTA